MGILKCIHCNHCLALTDLKLTIWIEKTYIVIMGSNNPVCFDSLVSDVVWLKLKDQVEKTITNILYKSKQTFMYDIVFKWNWKSLRFRKRYKSKLVSIGTWLVIYNVRFLIRLAASEWNVS